ncbi:hypothetical protein FCULG_00004526 [Fusarium culmorum]|uniref:Uncharacterized protein n=1 Tax=Fusarium culmorum TaxID=5516 RepID=A0A2T4HCK2_FUSCU|nr:hypothetical protein FCULG_00004526 [Fusarium culmorum]
MSLPAGNARTPCSEVAVTINHLPNEILIEIYHLLASLQDPVSLPIEFEKNTFREELLYDARQYNDLMWTKNHTALTLCLVTRRFNYLFKQFTFRNAVLPQYLLSMDQWTNRDDEELRNRCKYREARKVAGLMERLCKIITLNPGLIKHCGSLCYTHTPVNVYNELRTRSEVEEANARREARREELGSDYDSDDDGEPKWDYQTAYLPTSSLIDKIQYGFSGVDYVEKVEMLQGIAGTAPFTRLLTSADMHPDQLAAMVAWPRRLERLAMQTNPKLMTTTSVHEGSLQHILDSQKDSLTHLRIEGDYELGLRGFDLRDFPCLEHLALCNATIFGRDPGRPQDTFPDHYRHILAPHLRSLLWVIPPTQWDAEILSGVLHGMLALMQIMDMKRAFLEENMVADSEAAA